MNQSDTNAGADAGDRRAARPTTRERHARPGVLVARGRRGVLAAQVGHEPGAVDDQQADRADDRDRRRRGGSPGRAS